MREIGLIGEGLNEEGNDDYPIGGLFQVETKRKTEKFEIDSEDLSKKCGSTAFSVDD